MGEFIFDCSQAIIDASGCVGLFQIFQASHDVIICCVYLPGFSRII